MAAAGQAGMRWGLRFVGGLGHEPEARATFIAQLVEGEPGARSGGGLKREGRSARREESRESREILLQPREAPWSPSFDMPSNF